jgi:predicted secreted protein
MSDVRVETSGKVALLSHCLLNQNSKPFMRARYPGAVTPVVEVLLERGYALFQLPCPEVAFTGLNRWSAVIEQYDTPRYRRHCRQIAAQVVDQLAQYPRYGYRCLLIGIDGSPTCGIRLTGSSENWRGFPGALEPGEIYPVRGGSGILMQELTGEFQARGLGELPAFGVGLDLHGVDLDSLGSTFEKTLGAIESSLSGGDAI